MKKLRGTLAVFAGLVVAGSAPANPVTATITLDPRAAQPIAGTRSVGMNFEMALTSDAMWNARQRWIERTFRELGVGMLRWGYSAIWWDAFAEKPLTENYWSAVNSPDDRGTLGFKEFVASCKRTGTTPSIMLPVDALAAGVSLDHVVALSRRMVTYLRDQNLTTPVYIEMGNEPYHKPFLPPEKYAEALRTLYPMVKSIAPEFRVVAHVNKRYHPFITQHCAEFYDVVQWHHYLTCGGKIADPWQWYYAQDKTDLARLSEGDVEITIPPGKEYQIGEINVLWPDWDASMAGDLRSSLAYLDLLLSTINTGRANAILPWPSHWPAHKGAPGYGLFDYDAFVSRGETRHFPAVLGVHGLLRDAVLELLTPAVSSDPKLRVFAYAQRDGRQQNLVIINKRPQAVIARVELPSPPLSGEATQLAGTSSPPPLGGDATAYGPLKGLSFAGNRSELTLPPESAVLIRWKL